jgi:Fe-S-cluster-containing dehydrogenase component
MAKVFVIDVAKCTGCYNCQYACKDEHVGNDWAPIARPQPEIGQFWMNVEEHICGTTPKVKAHYIPRLCNHCKNAPCIAAAKDGAAYRRADGLVIFDTEKAKGQKQLMEACPYGAVYWNEALELPQKCTGCAHLLDNGYAQPRCVEVCPTQALRFGEEEELSELIDGAQVRQPETGAAPRVYYRNIPGQFIAGTVYDPVEKEVIIGAKVRALSGGKRVEAVTNGYGDFWLRDLPVGRFDVYIDAKGFETKVFAGVSTQECVNLGDIPLDKK